jgi:hypothetical protein
MAASCALAVAVVALTTGLLWGAAAQVRAHEQALRDSEAAVRLQAAQLAAFFDTAAIGLHRVGPDGTILWANDAELEMLGGRSARRYASSWRTTTRTRPRV